MFSASCNRYSIVRARRQQLAMVYDVSHRHALDRSGQRIPPQRTANRRRTSSKRAGRGARPAKKTQTHTVTPHSPTYTAHRAASPLPRRPISPDYRLREIGSSPVASLPVHRQVVSSTTATSWTSPPHITPRGTGRAPRSHTLTNTTNSQSQSHTHPVSGTRVLYYRTIIGRVPTSSSFVIIQDFGTEDVPVNAREFC
jgi:hypothetical protein